MQYTQIIKNYICDRCNANEEIECVDEGRYSMWVEVPSWLYYGRRTFGEGNVHLCLTCSMDAKIMFKEWMEKKDG